MENMEERMKRRLNWFQTDEVTFTAFDFETATSDRMPCQLGLVEVYKGEIIDEKLFMIKPPGNRYDIRCSRVHGITAKDTESCKEWDELWDEIWLYFYNALMVSHNVDFDYDVFERVCSFYDLPEMETTKFYDTMCLFDDGQRSLSDIACAMGIEMEKHHDALSDARTCAKILLEYLNGIDLFELQYPERKVKEKIRKKYVENTNSVISKDSKIQDLSLAEDTNNLFYNKKIVISGIFENFPERDRLAFLLKQSGAKINDNISSKTDIFLTGSNWGPKKMEEVAKLRTKGYKIQIMNELALISELTNNNLWQRKN